MNKGRVFRFFNLFHFAAYHFHVAERKAVKPNERYIESIGNLPKVQICQKKQISLDLKKYRYVGVIATFGNHILLPANGMSLKDGPPVISLQYL